MVSKQSFLQFFNYAQCVEQFNDKNKTSYQVQELSFVIHSDASLRTHVHSALINWAVRCKCQGVRFWFCSGLFPVKSSFIQEGSLYSMSLQSFTETALQKISCPITEVFSSGKMGGENCSVCFVVNFDFPAFIMEINGKKELFFSSKMVTSENRYLSSSDLLEETKISCFEEMQRLDPFLEHKSGGVHISGALEMKFQENFLSLVNWAIFDENVFSSVLEQSKRCFNDLYKARGRSDWKFVFSGATLSDSSLVVHAENVVFLSLVWKFFVDFFEYLLVIIGGVCQEFLQIDAKNLGSVNVVIDIKNRNSNLLVFDETFGNRLQWLFFYNAVQSAIIHDGIQILSVGGFYCSFNDIASYDVSLKIAFSRWKEKLTRLRNENVWSFSCNEEFFSLSKGFLKVSSRGICLQGISRFVDLGLLLAVLFQSIAGQLGLSLDIFIDEIRGGNIKPDLKLTADALMKLGVNGEAFLHSKGLLQTDSLQIHHLLETSSALEGLFFMPYKEMFYEELFCWYANYYRKLLLQEKCFVEKQLQIFKLEKKRKSFLEKMLKELKNFCKEAEDLKSEAMIFAFSKLGKDLLIRIQQGINGD